MARCPAFAHRAAEARYFMVACGRMWSSVVKRWYMVVPARRLIPVCEVSVAGQSRSLLADLSGASKKDILKLAETHGVRFLRLTFTDILGINKNVEIPSSQFSKALDGDIMFDGSSIEGFVRIEESDMLLSPDLSTFVVFPWSDPESRVCRLICDINQPDGTPFPGDPRGVLKRALARAAAL